MVGRRAALRHVRLDGNVPIVPILSTRLPTMGTDGESQQRQVLAHYKVVMIAKHVKSWQAVGSFGGFFPSSVASQSLPKLFSTEAEDKCKNLCAMPAIRGAPKAGAVVALEKLNKS